MEKALKHRRSLATVPSPLRGPEYKGAAVLPIWLDDAGGKKVAGKKHSALGIRSYHCPWNLTSS